MNVNKLKLKTFSDSNICRNEVSRQDKELAKVIKGIKLIFLEYPLFQEITQKLKYETFATKTF